MTSSAHWPQPAPGFPAIVNVAQSDAQLTLTLAISSDLPWFRGHFPGEPVLPGIIQTHWAAQYARMAFDLPSQPATIKRLKFRKVVVPPQEIDLVLSRSAPLEVQFHYASAGHQHSQGRLVFAGATP